MMPHKICRNDVKKLSQADRTMLCSVYLYRCLTLDQMAEFFYKKENPRRSYAEWHLKEMVDDNYLTPVSYLDNKTGSEAYFLTSTGIAMVKRLLEIPSTQLPGAPCRISDYDWHASDLRLSPGKINHQVHLNTFALRFAAALNRPFEYFDEKFVPNKDIYSMRARADGLAELPEQSIYFELDMGTESLSALKEKWYGYQTLVNSYDFFMAVQKKRGTILFVLDNVKRPEVRRRTVLKSLAESHMLNLLTKNFDLYIGTPDEMLEICNEHLFPSAEWEAKQRVESVLRAEKAITVLEQTSTDASTFDFLCRKDNMLFGVDVFDRVQASVLSKCLCANRDRTYLQAQYQMPFRHLTVTTSPELTDHLVGVVEGEGIEANLFADIKDAENGNLFMNSYSLNNFGERIYHKGGICHGNQ